ncbi:hypothetical protein BZL54_22120 [Burkholderia ubonensis subsp. mesacidophila]|uniref:Non-ribosomal peptide synthetase n=2 Tax=Burkholderia ubonensis TaxID=101571 RepID=A0A2A4F9U4_9BURK|nr:hypothetical protein BZL54_22120 [Burkholderia ubonensis subsp. mesacidophila]
MKTTDLFPCAYGQEGLYFLDRIAAAAALYTVPYTLEFAADIDRGALAAALDGLVARHDALRASFVEIDGQVHQRIGDAARCELDWQDLADLDDDVRAATVDTLSQRFAARGFDLARGPLIRAMLVRLARERHLLLLGIHHIVFDGWSAQVLAQELDTLYQACRRGGTPDLPDPPAQYREFAQWQRERYAHHEMADDLAYWQAALRGAPTVLNLPFDRPRAAVRRYAGDLVRANLPPDAAAGFAALLDALGTTPFVLFATLANVLLHRLSGERDLCVGYPVAGRHHVEFEDTIGLFTNMLVLRSRVDEATTFRMAVERTQQQVLDAFDHAAMPFDRLVEVLEPARSLGWHPLFQVCVTHEADDQGWVLDGVRARDAHIPTHTAKFDLLLAIEQDTDQQWRLKAEYSTELFERTTIDRMLAQLMRLVASAAGDPDQPIGRLRLLDDATLDWLMRMGTGPTPALPSASIATLFEAQAARTPEHAALVHGAHELTYDALNALANRLAWRLKALHVGPETPVGLLTGRGFNMVVGILGILKAGGCYVPLDSNYQAERLNHLLHNSGIAIVVREPQFRTALLDAASGLTFVELAPVAPDPAACSDESANPPRLETPAQLAYIMYTSGSTGRPKGVAIDHRAIARLVLDNPFLPFERGLTIPQLASASFDPSTLEIWGALLHGGTVALVENHLMLDPAEFSAFLQRHRIRAINFASTLLSRLSHEMPGMFVDVEHILFGGDRADAAALLRLRETGVRAELINGYGPTEVTTLSCTHVVRDEDLRDGDVPIGRPFANTCAHILDEDMQPVPVGVPGELYLGGAGLARGYYRQPDLTAERFVPNPFAGAPGSRLYRTGDICVRDARGDIRYKGRRDGQVKIDGFRVEFGEVLAELLKHPDVNEAVVDVELDGLGQKRLVAYVVLERDGPEPSVRAIRQWMSDRLPAYLSPKRIYAVPGIPLTSHGKPDLAALRAHAHEPGRTPEPQGGAATGLSAQFFALTRALLNVDALATDESFYVNGGSSLSAIRLAARCARELGHKLPFAVLLGNASLAECAEALEPVAAETPRPRGDAHREPATEPLSAPQLGLYFIDKATTGNSSYAIRYVLEFDGVVDPAPLGAAFDLLIERHEALRTTFIETGAQVHQHIGAAEPFELGWLDLSTLDAAARDAALHDATRDFAVRPFDLARGPLLQATLVRMAQERHLLLFGIHHIVVDGWSAQIMARELDMLYRAFRHGRAPVLPDTPGQYREFVRWQRDVYAHGDLPGDLAYWRDTLRGAPALLNLPLDRPRPPVRSHTGGVARIALSPDATAAFAAQVKALQTTPFVLFATAVSALLHRISSERDICIGYPVAGRGRPEFENTLGLFANLLVLRTRFDEQATFRDAVAHTRQRVHDALDHAHLPFDRLVEALEPARSLGWHPLFQVCVTHETDERMWELDGIRAREIELPAQTAKFDLSFALCDGPDGMTISVEYAADLFLEHSARGFLDSLVALLAAMHADPDRTVLQALDVQSFRKPRTGLRSARNAGAAPAPAERVSAGTRE